MEYNAYTYIVASPSDVLYIWVTNDLQRRISEHKEWKIEWFSKKYGCKKLIYYEYTPYIYNAIEREKELKWWNRKKKIELIETINPSWKDLYNDIIS
jgi:putative endonuclease